MTIALKPRSKRFATVAAVVIAAIATLSGAPQLPPYGGADELRADLAARRARAMDALGPASILVAWSARAKVYSTDVNYEYRQESNMLYLSGMTQEETILVLIPGAKTQREVPFTREADPRREHWNGHTLTPAEVTTESGVRTVYPLSAFQPFIDGLLGGTGYPAARRGGGGGIRRRLSRPSEHGKARLGILERVGAPADRWTRRRAGSAAGSRLLQDRGRHGRCRWPRSIRASRLRRRAHRDHPPVR